MERSCVTRAVVCMALAAVLSAVPEGQSPPKANWLTDGGDPHRNAWQRNETIITKDSVKQMKLAWKVQLDNEPRQMHSLLSAAAWISDVATKDGLKQIAVADRQSPTTSTASMSRRARSSGRSNSTALYKEPPPQPGGRSAAARALSGGITATPVIAATTTPGRYIVYAVSWDGTAPSARCRNGSGNGAARALRAAERKTVRTEPWP